MSTLDLIAVGAACLALCWFFHATFGKVCRDYRRRAQGRITMPDDWDWKTGRIIHE